MKTNQDKAPAAEEIRETLRRILASPGFTGAPRLGDFLRFVVESTLAGETDTIKGYTIAVEALGRKDSFDPKTDPIVRVEAGRLRRALARYYMRADAKGAVVIELPLGSYVPIFRSPKPGRTAADLIAELRRQLAGPRGVAATLASLLLIVAIAYGMFSAIGSRRVADGLATNATISAASARGSSAGSPLGHMLPVLLVQRFDAIGGSPQQAAELEAFRSSLRDALARFDEIEIASETAAAKARDAYRLVGAATHRDDGIVSLSLWLNDVDDATIVWSQTFEVGSGDARSAYDDITLQVAPKLAQPYGVIYARELANSRGDPNYRCLIGALEFRRGFDRPTGIEAGRCLERLVEQNPNFVEGAAVLSLLALREFYEGDTAGTQELQRATMLAQRAVDLKPQSARARYALMSALFARREIAEALAEGKAAVAANPFDMIILHAYGTRLVLSDRAEEGAPLVRRAVAHTPVRPASFEVGLFLSAYALGDSENLAAHARLFTNNDYPLLLVARAVTAVRIGEPDQARQAVDRLVTLHPGWRNNARRRIERYVPSPGLVDRLVHDLAEAGLVETR